MFEPLYRNIQNMLKKCEFDKKTKEHENTRLFKVLQKNKNSWNIQILKSNITSMNNKSYPNRVRIRNDAFLKNSINKKNTLLFVPIKWIDNNVYHIIISSYWFKNYLYKCNGSNSFINFEYSILQKCIKNNGMYYRNVSLKNSDSDIKYAFLLLNDKEVNIDIMIEKYILFSKIYSRKNISKILANNVEDLSSTMDPPIPKDTREELYLFSNNSCIIHKYNKDHCRTKINWKATKEAVINTNLHVPLDFHHFVTKKIFKDAWLKKKINLDWTVIHSKINLIPLCQICHNSIHNKSKELVKQTFNNIINSMKHENVLEEFKSYLLECKIFNSIEDLLKWYLNNNDIKLYNDYSKVEAF